MLEVCGLVGWRSGGGVWVLPPLSAYVGCGGWSALGESLTMRHPWMSPFLLGVVMELSNLSILGPLLWVKPKFLICRDGWRHRSFIAPPLEDVILKFVFPCAPSWAGHTQHRGWQLVNWRCGCSVWRILWQRWRCWAMVWSRQDLISHLYSNVSEFLRAGLPLLQSQSCYIFQASSFELAYDDQQGLSGGEDHV
jgi:hypothetical protein